MQAKLRTVREIKNLRGKRVILRIDANVPIEKGRVRDDSRLWAVLPTIEYLSGRGAVVIMIAHLGRPKGIDPALSLAPIAKRLSAITGKLVTFVSDLGGPQTMRALATAVPGQVYLLENLRFDKGEESTLHHLQKNSPSLAMHM